MSKIAIIGCGWLGLPLAETLLGKGHDIHGSTTSEQKRVRLHQKGINAFLLILSEHAIEGDIDGFLRAVDILIINVPPRLRGSKKENYVAKIQQLHTAARKAHIPNVIFVSSTSVYGDVAGNVTEATKPVPNTESGRQLLQAETVFRNDSHIQTTIVRFGGLIGADRHPINMLSGRTGLTNGGNFVNLIHLNDCIRILKFIIDHQWWNEVFNGVYPAHPTKQEYYRSEAFKRGLEPPHYKKENLKKGKKVVSENLYSVKKVSLKTSIHS